MKVFVLLKFSMTDEDGTPVGEFLGVFGSNEKAEAVRHEILEDRDDLDPG